MVPRENRDAYVLFAQRLKIALDLRGYTQTDLSKKAGLSKGMISLYVSARSMPQSERLSVIASALNVSPVWLMGANVNRDGSAVVSKNEDEQVIREWLISSTPKQIALVRRLFEAVREECNGNPHMEQ